MLIDTHAHLHVKEFETDRTEVIARAEAAGVQLINVGFEPAGNKAARELALEHEKIFWTAGIHPHNANEATEENLQWISDAARPPRRQTGGEKLVALGEMGLDFFLPAGRQGKNHQPRDIQIKAFRAQLALARELDLPVIIHCREAFHNAFSVLREEGIRRAVFHCFTGGLSEAEYCWEHGFFTSYTGICTYPSAGALRAVIEKAPGDKIMLETDCPFLAPQGSRGMRNEPSLLREVFAKICEIRSADSSALEEQIFQNTLNFFPKIKIPLV